VAEEEDPNARVSRRLEHAPNVLDDPVALGNLLQDADLHVVDEQCGAARITRLFERLRDLHPERSLHDRPPFAGPAWHFKIDESASPGTSKMEEVQS
jgi:hypothetical protein